MTTIRYIKTALAAFILLFSSMLAFIVYNNYQKQYSIIINTHLELEANIIQEASRMSALWLNKRILDEDATIDQIEQEILINFIEPISLLNNGDAWIYNKDYVIFDKSSDFPDYYQGKSMRQIFEMQEALGAYHYEEMTTGVENASEGRGWYVWLPEKGKEWVAWTSFRFHDQTWTLGLSTPENEILEYNHIYSSLRNQIFYVLVLILILIIFAVILVKFQKGQEKMISRINDANKALQNINTMKNDFIANISHDFRTPLSIILNLTELNLSENKEITQGTREDLEVIYNTSFKFLSKINTLLDLTKIETTGLQLNVRKVNLSDFLTMITNYYSSLLRHSGIDVTFKTRQIESDFFYTDAEKLEDIINNIMSNAIKFITHSNGKISIELEETVAEARIRISDNGLGIEKENLEIIFNRYEQINTPSRIKYRGSGIGLSYCKQLIELIGGSIEADSPGKGLGAVFTLTIDKHKFAAEDAASEDKIKLFAPKQTIIRPNFSNPEKTGILITETNRQNEFNQYKGIILIVDDEPVIIDIVIRYLKSAGYKNFLTAQNGKTAIQMMNTYHPDLVITDLQMPEYNGDEFYEKVRRNPEFDFIPFIFISSIADEQIILEQKNRGAVDYLLKPIKRNELFISVNTNMRKYMEFIRVSAVDELTKLFNRRVFFKNFESMVLNPAVSNMSLILLDLDHFKTVNDTYGHQAGDFILTQICAHILNMTRSQDIAGRYGGEEFGILLPDTGIEHATIVAEKIRKEIETLDLKYNEDVIRATVSIGIASFEQCSIPEDESGQEINYVAKIVSMADAALYEAKSAHCTSCSFSSRTAGTAITTCPECGSTLSAGRNKTKAYRKDMQAADNSAKTGPGERIPREPE